MIVHIFTNGNGDGVLRDMVSESMRQLGLPGEVISIEDIDATESRGIVTRPAIAVNGSVKLSGRLPTRTELHGLLVGLSQFPSV